MLGLSCSYISLICPHAFIDIPVLRSIGSMCSKFFCCVALTFLWRYCIIAFVVFGSGRCYEFIKLQANWLRKPYRNVNDGCCPPPLHSSTVSFTRCINHENTINHVKLFNLLCSLFLLATCLINVDDVPTG